MEKWRNQIEELLSKNDTVDRWLIHDLVWREDDPAHKATLAAMSHLMTAMRFLCTGQGDTSQSEMKERIKKSCAEVGLPIEAINGFFALLERQDLFGSEDRPKETTDEDTNESHGDDT